MLALLLVIPGVVIGAAVEGVVSSYRANRSFWPWPRQRRHKPCDSEAARASLAPAGNPDCPIHARHSPLRRLSRVLWALRIWVVMAAIFYGLGVQYAGQPPLLLVSLAEATLIDAELRLVPTPLVGLLALLALATANLWPGLGLRDALLGGAIGFATFALLVGLARLLFGAGAFGLGDAYLALVVGCVTGYPLVVGTLTLGVVLGGLGALAVLLSGKGTARSTIPYGPYVSPACSRCWSTGTRRTLSSEQTMSRSAGIGHPRRRPRSSVVLKRSVCSEQRLRLRSHGKAHADRSRLFAGTAKQAP